MKNLILLTLLLIFSVTLSFAQRPYLIKAGKLYDSEKNVFLKDQEIYVEGNKIKKVGKDLSVPENTIVLDFSTATVTPGLIDAHTHILSMQKLTLENDLDYLAFDAIMHSDETRVLRGAHFAKTYLQAGFTSIRDVGNSGFYLDVELRNAIRNGYVDGPRMFVSGPIIGSVDGQFGGLPPEEFKRITEQEYSTINGVNEAKRAVKEHIVQDIDLIKILGIGNRLTLSLEEMKAIVETAHENRITVTAHVDRDYVAKNVIEAGVDGIEHGYGFKDATLELMAQKGIYLTPTDNSVDLAAIAYKKLGIPYDIESLKKNFKSLQDRLIRAFNKGVMIVAGSDSYHDFGIPRGEAAKHTVLSYYDAGLKPNDVLRTATYNAAIALGQKDQIGVIRENALADIAVFGGDMEANFKESLFKVKWVMKDGKIYYDSGKE